jgi:hypothetical protein
MSETALDKHTINKDLLYVLTSAELGQGEVDLGMRLTEIHLKCLAGAEVRPGSIIFLNSAIMLTTEGSSVLEHLRELERGGTELVSCITCLNYHDRMEKVVVGTRAGMKETVEAMTTTSKVITL